jgi:hypothetical protein
MTETLPDPDTLTPDTPTEPDNEEDESVVPDDAEPSDES